LKFLELPTFLAQRIYRKHFDIPGLYDKNVLSCCLAPYFSGFAFVYYLGNAIKWRSIVAPAYG